MKRRKRKSPEVDPVKGNTRVLDIENAAIQEKEVNLTKNISGLDQKKTVDPDRQEKNIAIPVTKNTKNLIKK